MKITPIPMIIKKLVNCGVGGPTKFKLPPDNAVICYLSVIYLSLLFMLSYDQWPMRIENEADIYIGNVCP